MDLYVHIYIYIGKKKKKVAGGYYMYTEKGIYEGVRGVWLYSRRNGDGWEFVWRIAQRIRTETPLGRDKDQKEVYVQRYRYVLMCNARL